MSRHGSRQKLAREFGATDIVTERGDDGVSVRVRRRRHPVRYVIGGSERWRVKRATIRATNDSAGRQLDVGAAVETHARRAVDGEVVNQHMRHVRRQRGRQHAATRTSATARERQTRR